MIQGLCLLGATLAILPSAHATGLGGGYTAAGLCGSYFNNTTLTAPVSFTRQDVRLDFNWGTLQAPGGVGQSGEFGFSALGTSRYSVEWNGGVIPAYSEAYTFKVTTSAGVRIYFDGNTTAQIDHWGNTTAQTYTFTTTSLVAGKSYSIKVQYLDPASVSSAIQLKWSSPSTPEEVIQPTSSLARTIGGYDDINLAYANLFHFVSSQSDGGGTGHGESPKVVGWFTPAHQWPRTLPLIAVDANGWPLGDAACGINDSAAQGSRTLVFNGTAEVYLRGNFASATAGGVNYPATGSLTSGNGYEVVVPKGQGYDSHTNTTTMALQGQTKNATSWGSVSTLSFTQSSRDGSANNPGVTNVKVMAATNEGAATADDASCVFHPAFLNWLKTFTAIRWLTANANPEVNWADRQLPGYPMSQTAWEQMVLMANETGKDLYITVPIGATVGTGPTDTTSYVYKLAQLIKYGSDGVNPYSGPTANPVWAPLNSNLKVYFEWGNETWGGISWCRTAAAKVGADAKAANNADWSILSYDGYSDVSDGYWTHFMPERATALRTLQASNIFRSIYGDSAMPGTSSDPTVRPLIEWAPNGGMAAPRLSFLDNYFNNADGNGKYSGTLRPLSYYIWGGGAAHYYTVGNPAGAQNAVTFANQGFESPALPAGAAANGSTLSGASWTFSPATGTGDAGIYSSPSTLSIIKGPPSLGSVIAADGSTLYGIKVTNTSANPIAIYEVGRWMKVGEAATTMRVVQANRTGDATEMGAFSISSAGLSADGFAYSSRGDGKPIIIGADSAIYVLCWQNKGDAIYSGSTVAAKDGITISSSTGTTKPNAGWIVDNVTDGTTNQMYTPLDLKIAASTQKVGANDLCFVPKPASGKQAAYITGTGSITDTINITIPDTYSVTIMTAGKRSIAADKTGYINNDDGSLGAYINISLYDAAGKVVADITPDRMFSYLHDSRFAPPYYQASGNWWGNPRTQFIQFECLPAHLAVGTYRLVISGSPTNTPAMGIFVDEVTLNSGTALFSSAYPTVSQGELTNEGYIGTVQNDISWAKAYGLKGMTYESGFGLGSNPSIGGADAAGALDRYIRFHDPRTIALNRACIDIFDAAGGDVYCFGTFPQIESLATWESQPEPIAQSFIERNNALPAPPTNGITVPCVIPSGVYLLCSSETKNTLNKMGEWVCYNIVVQKNDVYQITVNTHGSDGVYNLLLDGDTNLLAKAATGGSITSTGFKLSPGIHSLRIQSSGPASFTVNTVTVSVVGAPPAPLLDSAYTFDSGTGRISWSADSGAKTYGIGCGTSSGRYDQFINSVHGNSATITGLNKNFNYYVAVYAIDDNGRRSLFSNELLLTQHSMSDQNLFTGKAVAVSSQYPNHDPAALNNGTAKDAFAFADSATQFACFSGLNSSVNQIVIYSTRGDLGGRSTPAVDIYYSLVNQTSTNPADYSPCNPLTYQLPCAYVTKEKTKCSIITVNIPEGTKSVLFGFHHDDQAYASPASKGGNGSVINKIQAFSGGSSVKTGP